MKQKQFGYTLVLVLFVWEDFEKREEIPTASSALEVLTEKDMETGVYHYSKVTERGTELQCPYSVSHLLNLCFTHLAAHLFLSYKASSEKKVIDTTPFSPKRHVFSFPKKNETVLFPSVQCCTSYSNLHSSWVKDVLPLGSWKHTTLFLFPFLHFERVSERPVPSLPHTQDKKQPRMRSAGRAG